MSIEQVGGSGRTGRPVKRQSPGQATTVPDYRYPVPRLHLWLETSMALTAQEKPGS